MQEHIYRHPWERVTAANWKKYADLEHRPLLTHVVDVNIVNRSVDQKDGQLLTTRSITVNAPGPWWLQRLMGTNVCHCLEESIVDNGNPLLPFSLTLDFLSPMCGLLLHMVSVTTDTGNPMLQASEL